MSKCRQFLEGLPHFDLVVDHNPLVPILNDYVMDNRRLLRLRLKMQRYAFTARWMPGKKNVDADALSRAPSSSPSTKDQLAQESVSFTVRNKILAIIGVSDVATLDREGQGSNSCRPNNDRTAAVDYLTINAIYRRQCAHTGRFVTAQRSTTPTVWSLSALGWSFRKAYTNTFNATCYCYTKAQPSDASELTWHCTSRTWVSTSPTPPEAVMIVHCTCKRLYMTVRTQYQ